MLRKLASSSWLLTAALAGFSIAYLMLVFMPIQRKIDACRKQLREKQQHVAMTLTLPATIKASEVSLAEILDYTEKWASTAPKSGDLSLLLGNLHNQVELAGATVTQFEPQAEVSMFRLRRVPVHVVCQGGYAQIARALIHLDQIPGTVWLESVQLGKSGKTGKDAGNIQCEMDLVVFTDKRESSG